MIPQQPNTARGAERGPEDPLEQFSIEHLRQREVCAALDRLALLKQPDQELVASVLPHFDRLLARHIHDEEQGLFPLLRKRSDPEDEINDTLDRLARKHEVSLKLAKRIKGIVHGMARENALPDPDQAAALAGFAAHERRHLIVENAIVLPLARARLTPADIDALRVRMAGQIREKDEKGYDDVG